MCTETPCKSVINKLYELMNSVQIGGDQKYISQPICSADDFLNINNICMHVCVYVLYNKYISTLIFLIMCVMSLSKQGSTLPTNSGTGAKYLPTKHIFHQQLPFFIILHFLYIITFLYNNIMIQKYKYSQIWTFWSL